MYLVLSVPSAIERSVFHAFLKGQQREYQSGARQEGLCAVAQCRRLRDGFIRVRLYDCFAYLREKRHAPKRKGIGLHTLSSCINTPVSKTQGCFFDKSKDSFSVLRILGR